MASVAQHKVHIEKEHTSKLCKGKGMRGVRVLNIARGW